MLSNKQSIKSESPKFMTEKTTSEKQLKPFRVERFMDSAEEPDNLTPPKKQEGVVLRNINPASRTLPVE